MLPELGLFLRRFVVFCLEADFSLKADVRVWPTDSLEIREVTEDTDERDAAPGEATLAGCGCTASLRAIAGAGFAGTLGGRLPLSSPELTAEESSFVNVPWRASGIGIDRLEDVELLAEDEVEFRESLGDDGGDDAFLLAEPPACLRLVVLVPRIWLPFVGVVNFGLGASAGLGGTAGGTVALLVVGDENSGRRRPLTPFASPSPAARGGEADSPALQILGPLLGEAAIASDGSDPAAFIVGPS